MRGLLAIAILTPLLVVLPASGQHGGGHPFAGGHSTAGGHAGSGVRSGMVSHGGFSAPSSGHAMSGLHSNPGFASHPGPRRSFGHSSFGHSSFGHSSFGHPSFSSRARRHSGSFPIVNNGFANCFGYACSGIYGYPWFYSGLIDPYWWWDSGSSYDADKQYEIEQANQMNAQSLDEQKARQQSEQDAYQRSAPPEQDYAPSSAHNPEAAVPPTVLVFRDQHRQEVQNYAIVGTTLWIFTSPRKKVPLADLDIDATQKANDERGVEFRLPGAAPGQ